MSNNQIFSKNSLYQLFHLKNLVSLDISNNRIYFNSNSLALLAMITAPFIEKLNDLFIRQDQCPMNEFYTVLNPRMSGMIPIIKKITLQDYN